MTGWPANPKLVRHLKSNLIRTCVHVDEAVMGLSVHADGDGEGENPLLKCNTDNTRPACTAACTADALAPSSFSTGIPTPQAQPAWRMGMSYGCTTTT